MPITTRFFRDIAKCRKVFMVETVDDCYVVVTGLQEPDKEHGITIIRLAMLRHYISRCETRPQKGFGLDTVRVALHGRPAMSGVLHGKHKAFSIQLLRQHEHCIMDGK